jgi:hypothetical protein
MLKRQEGIPTAAADVAFAAGMLKRQEGITTRVHSYDHQDRLQLLFS